MPSRYATEAELRLSEVVNLRAAWAAFHDTTHFIRVRKSLLLICLAAFLSSVGMGLTTPILSLYVSEFGVTTSLVGIFMTSFAVGRILVTFPGGRAADRRGGKGLMIGGAFLEAISTLWLAFAPSYPYLVIARLLQGVSSGLFMSAALIVIAELCEPEDRGRITSVFQASILLGLTVSPVIGGILASKFSLTTPILVSGMLALVVTYLVFWLIPDGKQAASRSALPAHSDELIVGSSVREMLTDRNFVLITLAAFLVFFARSGSRDTLLPLLGQTAVNLKAAELGVIFSLISLFNLITIPLAGIGSDHLGRKPPIVIGLLLHGLSLFIIGMSASALSFLLGALILGIAKGFVEPTSVIYVADISPAGSRGAAFGLFLTLRDLGLLVGPVALSWIADLFDLRLPFFVNALAFLVVSMLFASVANETYRKAGFSKTP